MRRAPRGPGWGGRLRLRLRRGALPLVCAATHLFIVFRLLDDAQGAHGGAQRRLHRGQAAQGALRRPKGGWWRAALRPGLWSMLSG